MALAAADRGSGADSSAGTSLIITPATNLSQLSWAVLAVAYDNSGASGADPFTSITDSGSNAWASRQAGLYDPGVASDGVCVRIFTCTQLRKFLTTADTITLSFGSSVTAKAWALFDVTAGAGMTVAYITGAVSVGSASATPTITSSSITNGDMIVGAGAAESPDTWAGDADVSNGSWSTQQHNGTGAGVAGMSVTTQRKVVTGSATQTYNPTLTSADCILAWIQLREIGATFFDPIGASGFFGI